MKADFFVTHAANFREHTSESANEHELVIEAIAAQDGERARALMEDHITLLGKYVVEHLSDDQGQLAEVV